MPLPDQMLMDKSGSPLISIIMAVKDTEVYLPACLDSILAQTYAHWELIAVNDHSSDRSAEILKEYAAKDNRVRVFHSDLHKLIPTLKYGYKHCRGPLINRMDSDDKMPPKKLEILAAAWQKYGRGTVIAGYTEHFVENGEVGDGFKKYDRWLRHVAKDKLHLEEIYRECVIPSSCWIIHKDDFEQAGGFEPEVYPEDYDLCFRLYSEGFNIIGIDHLLHYWRDRPDRISRTWDCYKDNRYFELKLKYFYGLDRELQRPLVLWGAGKNGKYMAQLLLKREPHFTWVCDNPKKVGKDIYGIGMEHFNRINTATNPQIIIVVQADDDKANIRKQLDAWGKKPCADYWFFS